MDTLTLRCAPCPMRKSNGFGAWLRAGAEKSGPRVRSWASAPVNWMLGGTPKPSACHPRQVRERVADQVPLIRLEYRRTAYWICPQHMPVLIHDPGQLVDKLPGAQNLSHVQSAPGEY